MVNRSLYLKIIGIVSLIVFLVLLGSVLLITGTSYFLSFVCLCIILLITLLLIRWMNGINRKIATFFESVRNGDTALRYPNKTETFCKGFVYGNEPDYPPIQSKPE